MGSVDERPPVGLKEQPHGVRVAPPPRSWSCWAVVTKQHGVGKLKTPRSCQCRAQTGRLTCVIHSGLEEEARKLEAAGAARGKQS